MLRGSPKKLPLHVLHEIQAFDRNPRHTELPLATYTVPPPLFSDIRTFFPSDSVQHNSSFAPIGDYLSAQGEEAIALPFSKVEELTGKPLCKSAYKYASYWYPAQDSPLSNTIYNAGYDVDRVDLAAGIVYLTKAA